jgi:hypothetical protein
MQSVSYCWNDADGEHAFELVHVGGTRGEPYSFGEPPSALVIDVRDFFIATVPVTQRLWTHIMGADANPAVNRGPDLPLENASWDHLTQPGGGLQRLNESSLATAIRDELSGPYEFRLASETAARTPSCAT